MAAIHTQGFEEELYARPPLAGCHLRAGEVKYSDDKTEREFSYWNKARQKVVSFRARPLPGCCGTLVVYYLRPSTRLSLKKQARVYQQTMSRILAAAHAAKYGQLMMTLLLESEEARLALETLEERDLYELAFESYENGKTGNEVVVYMWKLSSQEWPQLEVAAKFRSE
jgi:hypothetical protein